MTALQLAPVPDAVTARPDFADVYGQQLHAVWRYVRSRVPDAVEAQDVTSDVWVRAWRSWSRFDPARGPVEPWLFTIASRAVTDWWRRRRPEPVDHGAVADLVRADELGPQEAVLRDELLRQLATALDTLSEREREGLALRFAGRLSSPHVARVLGVSPAAAKQLVHRAVRKLRVTDVQDAELADEPADLDAVIDDVLARGGSGAGAEELRSALVHLAAVHDPAAPADLSQQVGDCVACEARTGAGGGAGGVRAAATTGGIGAAALAFVPVCLACVLPAAHALLVAVGLGVTGFYFHMAAPFVGLAAVWLMARAARRHGHRAGVHIALAGAVVLLVHLVRHDPVTDYLGLALLGIGALVNAAQTRRWRAAQRERFGLVVADAGVRVR